MGGRGDRLLDAGDWTSPSSTLINRLRGKWGRLLATISVGHSVRTVVVVVATGPFLAMDKKRAARMDTQLRLIESN